MRKKRKPIDIFLSIITYGAAMMTISAMIFILAYIIIKGVPNLKLELFTLTNLKISVIPPIITTIYMTLFALIISVPLGVFTAIYLVEYAKRGNKLVEVIRLTAETLSGIPSIVYGLFGYLFFVVYMKWGYSLVAGAFTMAIMILPLIMRTTEEALKSVPDTYREGAFGLGAGRLRMVFRVVLPSAVPGILSGVILAIGRIVGETAALLFTSGTVAKIPTSISDSARTLAIHMYALSSEGLYTNESHATALILLIIVVGINTFAGFIAKKVGRG